MNDPITKRCNDNAAVWDDRQRVKVRLRLLPRRGNACGAEWTAIGLLRKAKASLRNRDVGEEAKEVKEIIIGFDDHLVLRRAIVDSEDYDWLSAMNWSLAGDDRRGYYASRNLRKHEGGTGRHNRPKVLMHHLIVGYPLGGLVVDHINRNSLDNRRCNLRIVTNRQNQRNKSTYSGIRQVSKGSWNVPANLPTRELAEKVMNYIDKLMEGHENN